MARIRSIKPEFWTSEQIVECSPIARLLFVGMWTFADDLGRHKASIKRIKMQVFPGDAFTSEDISAMLAELVVNDLVTEYEAEGVTYWQVTGWHHQKIDRPQPSKFPGPLDEHSTSIRRTIVDGLEGSGGEGKGVDRKIHNPSTAVDDAPAIEGPKTTPPYPPAFETWWKHYPRKVGKKATLAAWKRARKTVGEEVLLTAVIAFGRSEKGRGEFCPHPKTWIDQGRYEDDPQEWTDERAATAEERGRHLSLEQQEREKEYRRRKTAALLAEATPEKDDDGNGLGEDWRQAIFRKVDHAEIDQK